MALRLPPTIRACLFDLDGVLTNTAEVHAAAWKQTFDGLLRRRAGDGPFVPFDALSDYDEYVDGRPRLEGTRTFLRARGIELPEGTESDPTGTDTVHGLSNEKNELLLTLLRDQGVRTFPGSVRFVEQARAMGLRTAVVSSSANCAQVVAAAGIDGLFDARVDGLVAAARHLAGKPAPDTFLAAAELLAVTPPQAAVFEDALAGVEAGRAGRFGLVVGVDRTGQADALRRHGADVVVADLEELIGPAS
ncbi:MAG TPA: beta-phosphoglucomutase family hydrolase [Acidimicrobiales bacterium]|nr:beta-phosphoglucomutase family hydrolase [Acidimicrobiales bacterium]